MKEKITGLDWRDFANINIGIDTVIKEYQHLIDNGSVTSDFWQDQIEELKATKEKISLNRSIDL